MQAPAAPPPDQVGAFRLTELLGQGGMGQVWKGLRNDGLFEQVVAVKLLDPRLTRLAGERFAVERRILASLDHPNIARLFDGGVLEGGGPFLIMEHVDGRPLDLFAAHLPLKARIELFLQAADAVQFAHERLIVHADLRPSNILVDGAGRVRLLDFGIARLLGEDDGGERAVDPTARMFASPARLAGAAPVVADDVYALGVILHGLIGETRDADLQAVAAMAKAEDAGRRYGSVVALTADLVRWREQRTVSARQGGWTYEAAKFVRRHRIGVGATVLAILTLSAASVVATVSYVRTEVARAEASARFEEVRGTARYLLFEFSDLLERQPQSLSLRADVARVSQSYLDRLAASDDAPLAVRIESAQALLRLAERQARPGRPNLGQTRQAKRNLERAYQMALGVPGPAGLRIAAEARLDQARLAAIVDNDLTAAERYLAQARGLILDPATPIVGLQGQYYAELSNLRQWQGRYPEAIEAARVGLTAPPPVDPRRAVLLEASLWDLFAEALYYDGRPKEAEAPYRRRILLLEDAARRWPSDANIARQLPRARWSLGSTLLELGRPADALPILQQGTVEARAVFEFDTADADAARSAQIVLTAQAQALAALGRAPEAITILTESVATRRTLWRQNPSEAMRLRDYAVGLSMLADVEFAAGRKGAACTRYGEVEAAFAELRRIGRATALDDDSTLKMARENRIARCG
ncbi:serine/threonine-protein kinase [Phenylobacterium sp.]|uniref:serine/threonine-protein kinase n=1 Tax=Phenylobacterium sp. TaxID=1871053 RepID=UPI00286BB9E6|nr:serine/threonine-protein kinase [Phenylobacterium sp.]